MPREAQVAKEARARRIAVVLRQTYPEAHCELDHRTPLQLLVATILSAQCTDKMVNRVTAGLFEKYHEAKDYAAVALPELENDIRSLGFFRNKAKAIKACCESLVERHGGAVPNTMEELTRLTGVGRKTANVVLGNAFGLSQGVVVDTHVARLSARLRLSRQPTAEKIEQELMALFPRRDWTLLSHWLIWHGRRRCRARKPDCSACELRSVCPSAGKV
jgi:endonuclease-3